MQSGRHIGTHPAHSGSYHPYQQQHHPQSSQQTASGPPPPALSIPIRVKHDPDAYPAMTGSAKGGASEFVKKLYKMLEDSAHFNIVSWGNKGDSFLVKDMNEFTKTVLPLHFKHSNFASFVRQLNKYDFHKVKAQDGGSAEGIYGDHTWEFRHPNFRADTKKSLEFIKRKGPAPRKQGGSASVSASIAGGGSAASDGAHSAGIAQLQQQFAMLQQWQQGMGQHMSNMSTDLHNVYAELVKFQHTFVAQDQLIQNIIQYLVRREGSGSTPERRMGTPSPEAQQLLNSYAEIAHASAEQLAELTRRASIAGGRYSPAPQFSMPPGQPPQSASSPSSTYEQESASPLTTAPSGFPPRPNYAQTYAATHMGSAEHTPHQDSPHGSSPAGPRTESYYNGPQSTAGGSVSYYAATSAEDSAGAQFAAAPTAVGSVSQTPNGIPAIANAEVSGDGSAWKHQPRVLVVEDDVVCRKLSSRFLEVFGCVIDTAVDGVEAVKKMNTQPYDLVFMDIAMPNLDGVSATSIIRQFNASTPIISMTSNSEPNDILTYFSHGMTDVLPKPFTKEALLGMLEKHLVHLTQIKQLVEVPRALGFPEAQIQDALASTLAPSYLQSEAMFGQEPLNPYAEMGITDEDFTSVLLSTLTPGNAGAGHAANPGNVTLEGPGKRSIMDDRAGDMAKRARFEA